MQSDKCLSWYASVFTTVVPMRIRRPVARSRTFA